MRKTTAFLSISAMSALIASGAAYAQDAKHAQDSDELIEVNEEFAEHWETDPPKKAEASQPQAAGETAGTASDEAMTSTAKSEEMSQNPLADQAVGFYPAAGILAFTDINGDGASRGAAGMILEGNLARLLPEELRVASFGVQTGLIYSHLGGTGSNFFGANADSSATGAGANFFLIPANLSVGWNFGRGRIGVHGGGNLTYRSVGDSMALSSDGTDSPGSSWTMYPNVGADFYVGFNRNIGLGIRPDVTITPGNDIFAGTVQLLINLG